MTAGGNDDGDPFELDPFGESEYDPSLAFALVAVQKTQELVERAKSTVERHLTDTSDRTNPISRSARKSSLQQVNDLDALVGDVIEAHAVASQANSDSPEHHEAIHRAVQHFHEVQGIVDQLTHTVTQTLTADPTLPSTAQPVISPASLLDPRPASLKVHQDLAQWLHLRMGNDKGEAVVVKATPGTGKTHAMLAEAYAAHLAKRRVVYSVRTKDMLNRSDAEMVQRIRNLSPTGKIGLAVIYGRDETNCYRHEAVEAVMAHGYAPGPSVCMQCEYYPSNSNLYGLGVCPYYEERIAADLMAKGARRGNYQLYPFVLTTHASPNTAWSIDGGRYGNFWSTDVWFVDEDPTDALEVDVVLTEEQCEFTSRSKETLRAETISKVFAEAIEIAKRERHGSEQQSFRASTRSEAHTDPIHSKYDSCYTGRDLQVLLDQARQSIGKLVTLPSELPQLLRSVADSGGFYVSPGSLAQVNSPEDINNEDVPPKSLRVIADTIHGEMAHALQLERSVFQQTMGRHPQGNTPEAIKGELNAHTDLGPLSYVVRLECLPADVEKGRTQDEWRYVAREFRPIANHTATIVIGDAYAQKEHYEHLLQRPVDMIDVVSQLHPDARFTRISDRLCNISQLRRGGLQRVLLYVEALLQQNAKAGDRVLIYGHEELRPKVEQWLGGVAEKLDIVWAYEHWWGGRGKDEYNGWEFTVCISDPVLSMSGIKHVANARAFRDSVLAKTLDERLLHAQRCEVSGSRHGAVTALRNSHPRIALEHDRMDVAELTQALHRSRPAHNAVSCIAFGEMEQSPDLVAQTDLIVGPESRNITTSNAQRKRTAQKLATVDRFVTTDEALAAMLAIVRHYGVYTSWFAHALVVPVVPSPKSAVPYDTHAGTLVRDAAHRFGSDVDGFQDVAHRVDPAVLKGILKTAGSTYAASVIHRPESGAPTPDWRGVPGVGTSTATSSQRGDATEPASRPSSSSRSRTSARRGVPAAATENRSNELLGALPSPRTVIERVWHPPAYWRLVAAVRSQPYTIRVAHERLSELARRSGSPIRAKQTERWPKWAKGLMKGGRRPVLFYDPSILRVDAALREYYRIVETQYGPVRNGRVSRVNAVREVPMSLSEVPF